MAEVLITADARAQFEALPLEIQGRALAVFDRLAKWPEVSGAKALTGQLKGSWRIRTGACRIVFRIEGDNVVIWRFGNRKDVYLD